MPCKPHTYERTRSKTKDLYVAIPYEQVPVCTTWTKHKGRPSQSVVVFFNPGKIYKLVRDSSGDVAYYRLIDLKPMSPKELIDAEPTRPAAHSRRRRRVGSHCWFVDIRSRWYLCEVVAIAMQRITIRCITGWDDLREVEWPYGGDLELPPRMSNHLRPISMRRA